MTVRLPSGRSTCIYDNYAKNYQRADNKLKELIFHNAPPPLSWDLAMIKEATDRQRQRPRTL